MIIIGIHHSLDGRVLVTLDLIMVCSSCQRMRHGIRRESAVVVTMGLMFMSYSPPESMCVSELVSTFPSDTLRRVKQQGSPARAGVRVRLKKTGVQVTYLVLSWIMDQGSGIMQLNNAHY